MKVIAIAAGGVLGALSRYYLSAFVYRYNSGSFPVGTLSVNISGCFLIGFLWLVSERFMLPPYFKPLVFIGFLGAFTTFSTFGIETFGLLRDNEIKLALMNILLSNLLGIAAVIAGFGAAKLIFGRV